MNLDQTISFLDRIEKTSRKKSEIRLYQSFRVLLADLKSKDLSSNDFNAIATELDKLQLSNNSENKKKHINKAFISFKKYLKEEFSFITEGYYTGIGISLGIAMGVAIGTAIGQSTGIALGISIGLAIGIAIGKNLDHKAQKENKVLKIKQKQ